jgi:hypothetical protein
MYRYYLGAFGNRSFIRPQFEIIEGGGLREIGDNRWSEFPNGGTVTLSYLSDNDTNDIKNRLLRFKIDFNKDLHPGYTSFNENSNKYQINLVNIEELDKDEIIEIIDIDYTIVEFLNDKTKRTIRIKHKPNKLILLRHGQDCFGPFEFMISDIEDSFSDETFYTLKVFVSSGTINKYKSNDLERIVMDGNFSIRRSDNLQFIYKMDKLQEVTPAEEIDYFDNEELADFFKELLDKSDEIENIAVIREHFLEIADSFSEDDMLSDRKIQRICELLQTSVDLSDYKVRITEEYFRSNPNAQEDKEEYLRTHEELLNRIVREDIQYEERTKELLDKLASLQEHKDKVILAIEEGQNKLNDQQAELEKLGEQAIAQKKQEIQNLLASQKKELDDVNAAIESAKKECKQKEIDRDFWKKQCDSLRDECTTITNDINAKIIEWAADNRNTDIIRLLVSQLELPEDETLEVIPQKLDNLRENLNAEQLVAVLNNKFAEAGRAVTKDEAYNYLISVVQNYITVFAGEPGTGKTSLCKLLAKTLGLYGTRFAEILVERGWTSSKDLIGYYNPLTKEIEKTQPKFSDCMEQLSLENANNIVEAPYFILLDEANLSPIEFYWSHFNYYCDNPTHQEVLYSNGEKYEFGAELKFLATINYDQTTTDLSPRFLDRAWVISMNPVSVDAIVSGLVDDSVVGNNEEVISLESLNSVFDWRNVKEKKMNPITKTRLDRIVDKMKEGGHTISARSINAISHYYLVAEKYMSSKEVALDYAISQKILPCICGNGKKYGEFLNGLMSICKENQLNKSASIISKIIDRAEHEFYGFFNL